MTRLLMPWGKPTPVMPGRSSTDLEWWHRDVLGAGAEVRYLRGRVRFLQGERWVSGMFPSVVVVWRP